MDIKSIKSSISFRNRPLIFLDLELTGLLVQKHEILEIGALKVSSKKPFKITDELDIKVKPNFLEKADKDALRVVKFTPEDWKDALSLEEALKKLDEFGNEGVLVGWNVNMDWAVLDKAYFFLGRLDPFHYHRLDVLSMAYLKLRSKAKLKKFSLAEVCKLLKIPQENHHQALDDAKTTYLVFKKLLEE